MKILNRSALEENNLVDLMSFCKDLCMNLRKNRRFFNFSLTKLTSDGNKVNWTKRGLSLWIISIGVIDVPNQGLVRGVYDFNRLRVQRIYITTS